MVLAGLIVMDKPFLHTGSRTLKVRGGIIFQANIYLGGFCSSQRIFLPQIIQVLPGRKRAPLPETEEPMITLDFITALFYTYCISRRNLRGGIHLRTR